MTRQEVLNRMFTGKAVRITPDFREQWATCNGVFYCVLGQWFTIMGYNADDTVRLVSNDTHQMYMNAEISALKP